MTIYIVFHLYSQLQTYNLKKLHYLITTMMKTFSMAILLLEKHFILIY